MPPEVHDDTRLKMYVLVRKDILTDVQVGVQSAHALVEYAHAFGSQMVYQDWVENHKTLIFLSATEREIEVTKNLFNRLGRRWRGFNEPDIGNIQTAVAFQPCTHMEGSELFKSFKLA